MLRLHGFTAAFILTMFAAVGQMTADNVDQWAQADLMPAAELNRQLSAVKAGKIILLQVGFQVLYKQGHIPGSQYAGPGSKTEGLESFPAGRRLSYIAVAVRGRNVPIFARPFER